MKTGGGANKSSLIKTKVKTFRRNKMKRQRADVTETGSYCSRWLVWKCVALKSSEGPTYFLNHAKIELFLIFT